MERWQPLLQHAEQYPNLHWTLYGVRSFPLLHCFVAWHRIYWEKGMEKHTWYIIFVLVVHWILLICFLLLASTQVNCPHRLGEIAELCISYQGLGTPYLRNKI